MKIKELSIDLETYSDVDIKKSGIYKYSESDSFEILLFAVSVNAGPVTVYDLASSERLPQEIIAAIADDNVIKWAFNASFERICLSNWLRKHCPEYFKSYSIPEDTVTNYLDLQKQMVVGLVTFHNTLLISGSFLNPITFVTLK